jgi:transposase
LRHLACLEEEIELLNTEILVRMKGELFEKAFTLLQTIPGVGQLAAAAILAEVGADMTVFPTPEQMASWGGVVSRKTGERWGFKRWPDDTRSSAVSWNGTFRVFGSRFCLYPC